MSVLVDDFFKRLALIGRPVLADRSGSLRRSIGGAELADRLDRLASIFVDAGAKPGDRLVAVFDNTLESALTLLVAMRHGFTLCLQPVGATHEDLIHLQSTLDAKAIINASSDNIPAAIPINLNAVDSLEPITPAGVDPRTPLTITFTSGSTGLPKGVVHAAESFLMCAQAFNHQTCISAEDNFLNVMPMYYMAGIFNGILAPLSAGASVVIDDAFKVDTAMRFWSIISRDAISALWLSPTMLSLVMRLDRTDKKIPPSLRRLFIGTGAMAASDAELFTRTYGLYPLQSYGLSELLFVSVDSVEFPEPGSVGTPLQGVEVICDSTQPLTIRSGYAFLGYYVDGSFRPHQGAFVTSDLGSLSETGSLSILGRADDIILRGGVNVNPVDLETLLTPLMAGRRFCITGVDDPALGQRVVLVTEGSSLSDSLLREAQMMIRRHPGRVQLDSAAHVSELPIGPTGKIRRSVLKSMLANQA